MFHKLVRYRPSGNDSRVNDQSKVLSEEKPEVLWSLSGSRSGGHRGGLLDDDC